MLYDARKRHERPKDHNTITPNVTRNPINRHNNRCKITEHLDLCR
jgi:hypothetical protein